MAEIIVLFAPGAAVPHSNPALKISRLSGENASVSGGTLSHKSFALVPKPPRYFSVKL